MESQLIFKSCFYFVIYQNGQFESFVVLCNKSLNDRSLGEHWILFPSNLDISFYFVLGNKIPCSPQGQSLSVTCLFQFLTEILWLMHSSRMISNGNCPKHVHKQLVNHLNVGGLLSDQSASSICLLFDATQHNLANKDLQLLHCLRLLQLWKLRAVICYSTGLEIPTDIVANKLTFCVLSSELRIQVSQKIATSFFCKWRPIQYCYWINVTKASSQNGICTSL